MNTNNNKFNYKNLSTKTSMKNKLSSVLCLMMMTYPLSGFTQKNNSQAGEITSVEWNMFGTMSVTYAVGRSGQSIQVDCTAFNDKGKPIGGGFSFTAGGVATVSIDVPTNFKNSNKVTVTCSPPR